MKSVWRTDKGNRRENNEDSVFCGDMLFMVADGMGGHNAGEVASNMAVQKLQRLSALSSVSVQAMRNAVLDANRQIFLQAQKDIVCRGMGTTLTALWMDRDGVLIAQVGDSRAYLLRGGKLMRCTRDHSLVEEMIRKGELTREEARTYRYRNIITRAIGTEITVETDIFEYDRVPGDRWLVCSDGLTEYLDDDELEQILLSMDNEKAADRLLSLALERGGRDNISLILLEEEAGGECS